MSLSFEELLDEGFGVDVEAHWGAGFLTGRYRAGATSWTWAGLTDPALQGASAALDLGTGEGGKLAELPGLPPLTVATEEWMATVPAAVQTLVPRGIHLVVAGGARENTRPTEARRTGLPFRDSSYDVVLSLHDAFDPEEVRRVLKPGGRFVTQQVGSDETASVRALLGLDTEPEGWDLAEAIRQTEAGGLRVTGSGEERPAARFTDIAALIAYLRTIPWSVPELDRSAMHDKFAELHTRGELHSISHRFWLSAVA
ncbi:methyltransferase family protein [Kribbella sp. VKM Ac-2527]|uniref:Methyltransferase family protein n=1 Tax=Kribbella caucasensis TaxID=2512215 RepID=A0A4R6JM65_9ACTN|nr:class I SAM-dependent methyltransferase [Kribbella sp. VKM Ac-2527]TDO36421.1 methyltransferase family protein [Kribbella sp. VKM Ac-2527]